MQYLTLELIKHNSRIDGDCENEDLVRKGEAAEEIVLNFLNRTLEDLKEENGGEVPRPVEYATLLIVDDMYKNRGASNSFASYQKPYGVETFLYPYKKI